MPTSSYGHIAPMRQRLYQATATAYATVDGGCSIPTAVLRMLQKYRQYSMTGAWPAYAVLSR
jgi:hypothetical protein